MPNFSYLWLAGNGGMEKNIETIAMGYRGTTTRIHSFTPSYPKVSFFSHCAGLRVKAVFGDYRVCVETVNILRVSLQHEKRFPA